jgi:hypothetical protein
MKFVFLLGGVAGFILAAGTDFLADRSADRMLLDGAVGCLAGAILFRWFWTVLVRSIRETILARHAAASAPAPTPVAAPAAATATAGKK